MKKLLRPITAAAFGFTLAAGAYALPPDGPETWRPAGTALLRDDLLSQFHYVDDYHEFPVELEESEQVPGRYRLVNAYANYPTRFVDFPTDITNYTIIDCSDPEHVFISKGVGAYYVGQDACISFWSKADDLYFRRFEDWDKVQEYADCVGKLTDGIVTFPRGQVMIGSYTLTYTDRDYRGVNPEDAPDMLFLLANLHGKFRLRLPGAPEPEVKVELGGKFTAGGQIECTVEFGPDTEYADVAILPGDYIGGCERMVASGEIKSVRVTSGGTITVPPAEATRYTVVAVPYYKGHAHNATIATREIEPAATTWRSLCTAKYTEGFLHSNELAMNPSTGWQLEGGTYDVEVEYDAANLNQFRIREPYANYINTCISTYDYTRNHYIHLNATDPECVLVPPTTSGIGFFLEYLGVINVWSRADRYLSSGQYTVKQIKDKGWNGVLKNDVLTFGKNALYINLTDKAPQNWYLANSDGAFRLEMPAGTMERYAREMEQNALPQISAPDGGLDQWYTVQGVPLPAEPTQPGLYLHRSGGRISKAVK